MGSLMRGMAWGTAAVLAGCSVPEPQSTTTRPAETPGAQPEAGRAVESRSAQPSKLLGKRKIGAIPDRPINVSTSCKFRDETGYRGNLDLQVKNDDVRRFRAEVEIPKRGNCHFDLADFRQSKRHPVALAAGSRCTVQVWEQYDRVTVAFRDCQAQCSGDSFDYLWPILVDARTGKCS